ncbi:MAG: LURP-one-related/scramblase family protein [Actinomycetota bacterium]
MALPLPPAGWTRFLVKGRFAVGRDFAVIDPTTEQQAYYVDGKLGWRAQCEVRDARDAPVIRVRGNLMGIPKEVTISDPDGTEIAHLKAKLFSPVRSQMTITTASGESWKLIGSVLEKEYTVTAGDQPVLTITQKWLTVRDQFVIDIAPGVDPALALAIMWSVDRFVEQQ